MFSLGFGTLYNVQLYTLSVAAWSLLENVLLGQGRKWERGYHLHRTFWTNCVLKFRLERWSQEFSDNTSSSASPSSYLLGVMDFRAIAMSTLAIPSSFARPRPQGFSGNTSSDLENLPGVRDFRAFSSAYLSSAMLK